jgi:hypothetical protein
MRLIVCAFALIVIMALCGSYLAKQILAEAPGVIGTVAAQVQNAYEANRVKK